MFDYMTRRSPVGALVERMRARMSTKRYGTCPLGWISTDLLLTPMPGPEWIGSRSVSSEPDDDPSRPPLKLLPPIDPPRPEGPKPPVFCVVGLRS
jgi:hypothetical protein